MGTYFLLRSSRNMTDKCSICCGVFASCNLEIESKKYTKQSRTVDASRIIFLLRRVSSVHFFQAVAGDVWQDENDTSHLNPNTAAWFSDGSINHCDVALYALTDSGFDFSPCLWSDLAVHSAFLYFGLIDTDSTDAYFPVALALDPTPE